MQVTLVRVGEEAHFVAEERGQVAGVRSTPDPSEQRREIGGSPHPFVDAGELRQPHDYHGLSEHPLDRPAHPKVRHQREGGHQLGQFHRLRRRLRAAAERAGTLRHHTSALVGPPGRRLPSRELMGDDQRR